MQTTGIIKKIDELGRIVVPKEIRNNLNIRNDDNLEIFIDEEKIVLKKYYKLKKYESIIQKYMQIIKDIAYYNVIFTDKEKILISNCDINTNSLLKKSFLEIMEKRQIIITREISNIVLTDNYLINNYCIIYPLINNTELLGSIIYVFNNKISEENVKIANIINKILRNELENI